LRCPVRCERAKRVWALKNVVKNKGCLCVSCHAWRDRASGKLSTKLRGLRQRFCMLTRLGDQEPRAFDGGPFCVEVRPFNVLPAGQTWLEAMTLCPDGTPLAAHRTRRARARPA